MLLAAAVALWGCGQESTSTTGCVTPASESFVRPFEVDAADYPFRSCAFETDYGRVHYVDDGPRDASEVVLMVHGNPTWSFLYRNIARAMIEDGHRVVMLDHLGLGMSDAPSTADFDYRPRSHADHLEDLVVTLDLSNITLVVQDWGGPIGLAMATRQPDRIGRLLIMNTWAWSIDAERPGEHHALIGWYDQASRLSTLGPTAFCDFALSGQSELNAAEADPSRGAVYDRVLAAYLSPAMDPVTRAYRTAEPCAPMQILAESIVDDDAFQGEIEGRIGALRGKPYGLLFGLSDVLFGALRCDQDGASPCPGDSACVCNEDVLPARVSGGCADPAAADYHVCQRADGSLFEPYADRFEALLGREDLVLREAVTGADHMVQEWAPDRVIAALRALLVLEP
jgi:pimeloyl-ACP methyl ester carboxylesterase